MVDNEGKLYEVTRVVDRVYATKSGKVVSGYAVYFSIIGQGEDFEVNVPDLDPDLVDERIKLLIIKRGALSELGS